MVRPQYFQPTPDAPGFLRFAKGACLKIDYPLVQNDFSIVVVFKTMSFLSEPGQNGEYYKIITGGDAVGEHFSFGFTSEGKIRAEVGGEFVILESETGSPFGAINTGSKDW